MVADVEHADVVIVGARLAGMATAIPLARGGLKVVAVDKARFPSDTMSTHAMVPSAVQELLLLGALDRVLNLDPSRSHYLAVHEDGLRFRERFHPFHGIDYGLCIPRDLLDIQLVETARAAGVDVREKAALESVVFEGGRAAGIRYRAGGEVREIRASVVVGADGRKSRTAAELGVWEPYRGSKNGRGFAYRYIDDPRGLDTDEYGLYRFGKTVALALPACPRGRAIAVLMCDASEIPAFRADPEGMWQAKLDADTAWANRVGGAANMSPVRSTDDLSSFYRASSGQGWALVGDAGHFKDPVTGNGQRDALKHGRLLGEAIVVAIKDPATLDAALRKWEFQRDRDTVSTYHWGNRETRPNPSTPLVKQVLAGFANNPAEEPRFSNTFNRVKPIENTIHPILLGKALVRAMCTRGVSPLSVVREAAAAVPEEIDLRRHRLWEGFRSTRQFSTENQGWTVGRPPKTSVGANVVVPALAADQPAKSTTSIASGGSTSDDSS